MTLTVPEAARRIGRNPETVRRWIREGKLRSHKVGTQHVIEEADLEAAIDDVETLLLPSSWGRTRSPAGTGQSRTLTWPPGCRR